MKLKSHKTVEQIAKKHGVDTSFILKQLKMGEPIEHEHTQDHDLALDIALQHLGEIPDYYTRLKKMEDDAKKHPMKEHCGCEDNAVIELENKLKSMRDHSYDSIDKAMRRIMKKHDMTAKQLHNAFTNKHNKTPDDWAKDLKEGTLHHWFTGSKSKDGKPGWVQPDGSPCANEPGESKTPKCFSSKRLASLKRKGKKGKSLIQSAVRRKRELDSGQQDKSGASKPTYVRTFAKGKNDPNYIKAEPGIKEEMQIQEAEKDRPGKGSGKKDACYHKVKSRYSVWPSAYASGALTRCRKVGASNWGNKSEEVELRDVPVTSEPRYCPKCNRIESQNECKFGPSYWAMNSIPSKLKESMEKDHEYSMIRSELSTIRNAVKRLQKKVKSGEGNVEAWVQSKITKAADYIDAAADYVDSGEMDEDFGFTIDPQKHKELRKRQKIRALATSGSTEGERTAASTKLNDVKLPKLKENNLVNKILDELSEVSVTIEDANGNAYAEVVDLITPEPIKGFKSQVKEATRLQAQTGNVMLVMLNWRGKYYTLKMFFPQIKLPNRSDIEFELQKVYPGSKVVSHSVSEFTPGEPLIQPGCQGGSYGKPGPSKNYVKTMGEEIDIDEDWQSVNRKDKTDGLSQKAVDAYRREHPGSRLQTAVTEKNPGGKRAKRRKSFCRRMSGMRAKLTSAKTARDPDSRINKALRRWRCH